MEQSDATRDDTKGFQSWDEVTSEDIEQLQKELDNNKAEYDSMVRRSSVTDDEGAYSMAGYSALYLRSLIEEAEAIIKEWNRRQNDLP